MKGMEEGVSFFRRRDGPWNFQIIISPPYILYIHIESEVIRSFVCYINCLYKCASFLLTFPLRTR